MATEKAVFDNPALQKIRAERGLAGRIADRLKLTRQAIWMWTRVPAVHAVIVAEMLEMPVHVVCPEVFPPPHDPANNQKTQPEPASTKR